MSKECRCIHCKEVLKAETSMHLEWGQWSHLKDKHPKEFKKQENKEIGQLFKDNFEKRSDL